LLQFGAKTLQPRLEYFDRQPFLVRREIGNSLEKERPVVFYLPYFSTQVCDADVFLHGG
jgi:hypothetical protein